MRIISGSFKGKKILYLKSSVTRPLKDSVKESIFNVLLHSNLINRKIENSKILDLYSGVGSFGLECISRQSKEITFVEKDDKAIKVLRENLSNLMILNKAHIIMDSVKNYLKKDLKIKFDIIFFDPPFANNEYLDELNIIKEKKLFSKNHIVIIHREHRSTDSFKKFFEPLIIKKYARSKIIFGKFL